MSVRPENGGMPGGVCWRKHPYPEITNSDFAQLDADFRAACTFAGIEPRARQASKYRRKRGKAYKAWREKA
jgi:hypothetical protein